MKDNLLSNIILIGSIGLIIVGVSKGEVATVLTKAINICLECIGIG
ncbi:CD1871A family CXXC motif-containing protein [Tissierella sp. P1]|nr:CD1871A family CXXC motif-containing protein [Tissierella sp. P1]